MLLPFFGFIFTLTLWGSFYPVPFTGINPHERLRERLGGAVKTALVATGSYEAYNMTSNAWGRYHQPQSQSPSRSRSRSRPLTKPVYVTAYIDDYADKNHERLGDIPVLDDEDVVEADSYLEIACSLITGIRRRPRPEKKPRATRVVVSWLGYRYEFNPTVIASPTVESYYSPPMSPPSRAHFMTVVGTVVGCLVVGVGVCLVPVQSFASGLPGMMSQQCGYQFHRMYPGMTVYMDLDSLQLTVQRAPNVFSDAFSDVIGSSATAPAAPAPARAPAMVKAPDDENLARQSPPTRSRAYIAFFNTGMGVSSGVTAPRYNSPYVTPFPLPSFTPPPPLRQVIEARTNSQALIGPINIAPEPLPTRPIINWQQPLALSTSTSTSTSITFHPLLNQLIYRLLLTIAASHPTPVTTRPSCEIEVSNHTTPQTHSVALRRLENISPFVMVRLAQLLLARLEIESTKDTLISSSSTSTSSQSTLPAPLEENRPKKKQRMSQKKRRQRWKKDMLAKQDEVLKGIEEQPE